MGLPKPATRGECGELGRSKPCPHAGCRYHLCSGQTPSGKFELVELDDGCSDTCALAIADEGGRTLESVGEVLGLTRQRIFQVEQLALAKVRRALATFYDFRANEFAEVLASKPVGPALMARSTQKDEYLTKAELGSRMAQKRIPSGSVMPRVEMRIAASANGARIGSLDRSRDG